MTRHRFWFFAGLFLTTLSTLTLETLDTRLLSVLAWYHLSFFAVSVAMLGMSAGAVAVYLGNEAFTGEAGRRALARYGMLFAISVPLSHLANISVPVMDAITTNGAISLFVTTIVLGIPFYLSGVVVTIALTRNPGPIGLVYAVDLIGAACGSLLIMPMLGLNNITSSVSMTGAVAALGAFAFAVYARLEWVSGVLLAASLAAAALINSHAREPVRLIFQKGEYHAAAGMDTETWTIHGQVIRYKPGRGGPPLWSATVPLGRKMPVVGFTVLQVDGHAATVMTEWDGNPASLYWTQWDVSSVPYHIRPGGDVAVIGVGGGRDVLTAIHVRSKTIDGIEINRAFVDMLRGSHRKYAKIADYPGVRLIHDEARSYLTRTDKHYDVIQMSLIDTWAATGAGAFTLSENGLYTVEAWEIFLKRLARRGMLSVSRFYAYKHASETSRLVSVATAALLRIGTARPADHMALIAYGNLATLLVSNQPLSSDDMTRLMATARDHGFEFLLAPGEATSQKMLRKISSSRSIEEIREAVQDDTFDYTPATDDRPFFFNLLKPSLSYELPKLLYQAGGVLHGNLLATVTLCALIAIVSLLVLAVIAGPLVRSGLPELDASSFGFGVLYFALIGMGFMLTQIGLMQRFSIYLGHPTYAVVVVLFSMILASGIGSLLSDRMDVEKQLKWSYWLPLTTAAMLLAVSMLLQPLTARTIQMSLAVRCSVAVGMVTPIAALLGTFFPMGMRLLGRLSPIATAWMWGVNGATGVLASVIAVAISMWSGIHTNFRVALVAYALVAVPASLLWRRGRAGQDTGFRGRSR